MKTIGLLDCNNFFVSCERVFNPKARNKPAMVLSSNDGCVIARSQEVRDLGIEMGIPVFKIKNLIKEKNIQINSSNFHLYRDMSSRVMNILREFVDDVEVYSIDEAFIDLSNKKDPEKFCVELREKVKQYTGIPVSIGISNTKTLAKSANRIAKKGDGVFKIDEQNLEEVLKGIKIEDIWGVGRQNTNKLNNFGIITAFDLQSQNTEWLRKKFNIKIKDTVQELQGKPIENMQPQSKRRKSIISSKSFGKGVQDLNILKESVTRHIENASYELRYEKSLARFLTVYISTGFFQNNTYHKKETIEFEMASDDILKFIEQANKALDRIYKKEYVYKKTGICFSGITSKEYAYVSNLFGDTMDEINSVSKTLDNINNKFGRDTIKIASSGIKNDWKPNSDFCSNRFTTNWNEILSIK